MRAGAEDWKGAEALYTQAVAAQPDYPFAYVDRAGARRALNDPAGALLDLSRAIALDPDYPWSYIDRGKICAQQLHGPEAVADYSMAIRLDTGQLEAYALRAEALTGTGDVDGSIADWERLISLKPDYRSAYKPLATLAWTRGDWPKAQAAFLSAYKFQEDQHSLALCAALCAIRGGAPEALETSLAQAEIAQRTACAGGE